MMLVPSPSPKNSHIYVAFGADLKVGTRDWESKSSKVFFFVFVCGGGGG